MLLWGHGFQWQLEIGLKTGEMLMKRWISLILVCLMLMMLLPAVIFAASGPALDFELTAEGDTSVGSILTVTFRILRTDSSGGYRLNAMQNEIEYDRDCFELVPGSIQLLRGGSTVARPDQRTDGTKIIAVNDMLADYTASETICTFQLKVTGTKGSIRSSYAMAFSNDAENPKENLVRDASSKVTVGGGSSDDGKLHVTMRLIGAERAEKDVDLGEVKYLPDYVTWIPTTAFDLDEGATVYDLWVKATVDAGIRSIGADKNYVSTVYAPASLGGYELSEFTNGKRSGWMYTINGRHPGYGLKEQELHTGDVVIWHYVNDYSYEVADWFSEGQWQALGDGTYYNQWLKAPDYFGGKGGGVSEDSESGSGTSDEGGTSGIVIYVPADSTSWNTVVVPEDEFSKAVATAVTTGEKQITVVVTKAQENAEVIVELTRISARMAAQNGLGLRVEMPLGTVWIKPSDMKEVFSDAQDTVSFDIYRSTDNSVVVQIKEGNRSVSADGAFHSAIRTWAFGRTTVSAGDVVYLVNADGSETLVRKSLVEGKYVYTLLDGTAILKLRFNAKKCVDVQPENWFAEAVDFTSGHELFIGVSETEFGPRLTMTRAMLVTVLYRLEDTPPVKGIQKFADVATDTWYTDAVEWASENGIVNGVGNNRYAPNDEVTREQIATMLYRYAQYLGMDVSGRASLDKFYDGDQVSSWAKEAMEWAVKLGIFQGDDTGALNPKNNATRAEVATLMQRIVAMIVK